MGAEPHPQPPREPESADAPTGPRTIASEELFQGRRELLIRHAGEIYRLRITRNGKLILQK